MCTNALIIGAILGGHIGRMCNIGHRRRRSHRDRRGHRALAIPGDLIRGGDMMDPCATSARPALGGLTEECLLKVEAN